MRLLLCLTLPLALALGVFAAGPPATEQEQADSDAMQDVIYVGPPHPVMIRLHLRVDGRSVFARWESFMTRYFRMLDRNRSDALDRSEAGRAPTPAQMLQIFAGNITRIPIPRGIPERVAGGASPLDGDRDGRVSLDEFKDYYRKNGAGPVHIATVAANSTGGPDPLSDRLFDLLDTDRNGTLSRHELEHAERILARFDSDDNELVSPGELGTPLSMAQRRAIDAGGAVAIRPNAPSGTPRSNLLLVPREAQGRRMTEKLATTREVIGRYDRDGDGKLSREEIAFSRAEFARLDRNKDGKLDVLEMARWVSARPAGEFALQLSAGGTMMPRQVGLQAPQPIRGNDRTISLEGVRINVVPRGGFFSTRLETFLLQQFRQLDSERKGFITRRQAEEPRVSGLFRGIFDLADQNGDNRMTEAELKAYLSVVSTGPSAQVALFIFSTGQGLFQALDGNGDGQLSIRELRGAYKRLGGYDRDQDGAIARNEFPQQFMLAVGPSNGASAVPPPVAGAGGVPGAPQPVATGRGPLWFRKMDRNGDGDVSPAEWLGTKEDFERIDTDRDGILSPEEAEAFDVRVRR